MVDFLVLTIVGQLLFKFKYYVYFLKISLMRRSAAQDLPPQTVFSAITFAIYILMISKLVSVATGH